MDPSVLHNIKETALKLKDGTIIPKMESKVDSFVDRTTLLIGGSNSGKTKLVEHILNILKDQIPAAFIVAPSDGVTQSYHDKLPSRCIKEDLDKNFLIHLWKRQKNLTEIYKLANNLDILISIFRKINNQNALKVETHINRSVDSMLKKVSLQTMDYNQRQSQEKALNDSKKKFLIALYKQTIRLAKLNIHKYKLTETELLAVEYLDINPRILLVLDDCTEKFKGWMKLFKNEENIFEGIFYRGRHYHITLIFALHDDTYVVPELRKNARNIIYTTSQSAQYSLNKSSNGYTKEEMKQSREVINKVFTEPIEGIQTHKKLCYVRDAFHPFQYIIADSYVSFELACNPLKQLCKKLPNANDMLKNNPFVNRKKLMPGAYKQSMNHDLDSIQL